MTHPHRWKWAIHPRAHWHCERCGMQVRPSGRLNQYTAIDGAVTRGHTPPPCSTKAIDQPIDKAIAGAVRS